MSDNPKTAGEIISSIMNSITSPAKLAFAGYILLIFAGKIQPPSDSEFLTIAAIFFILQVLHDDYLRKLLNNLAGDKETNVTKGRTVLAIIFLISLIGVALLYIAHCEKTNDYIKDPVSTPSTLKQ